MIRKTSPKPITHYRYSHGADLFSHLCGDTFYASDEHNAKCCTLVEKKVNCKDCKKVLKDKK